MLIPSLVAGGSGIRREWLVGLVSLAPSFCSRPAPLSITPGPYIGSYNVGECSLVVDSSSRCAEWVEPPWPPVGHGFNNSGKGGGVCCGVYIIYREM